MTRALFLKVTIALAILLAGLHLDTVSEANAAYATDGHCTQATPSCEGPAPAETGDEAPHHHHCPLATAPGDGCSRGAPSSFDDAFMFFDPAALTSHSTAPPLDPPLA